MTIKIFGDYSDLEAELDRLEDLPNLKQKNKLDAVLKEVFALTDAQVHVITGSLKASGRSSSEEDGDKWIGTLTWGGPSTGVNNPVDYAIYEKRRDLSHDWLNGVEIFHLVWVATIKAGLKG